MKNVFTLKKLQFGAGGQIRFICNQVKDIIGFCLSSYDENGIEFTYILTLFLET